MNFKKYHYGTFKYLKNIHILVALIGIGLLTNCQPAKYRAHRQLSNLQEGVLLVRLLTAEKTIAYYQKAGLSKEANAVKLKKQKENEELMAAYKKEFNFCPVYFFYSSETEKIKNGKIEEVQLFDAENQPVSSNVLKKNKFLIATMGSVYDTELTYEDQGESRFAAGINGTSALVVLTPQLIRTQKPFPYLTKINIRSKNSIVRNFNTELTLEASRLDRWWIRKKAQGKDIQIEEKSKE